MSRNREDIENLFNEMLKLDKKDVVERLSEILPFKIKDRDEIEPYGKIFEMYCHFLKLVFPRSEVVNILNELLESENLLNKESYWYLHQKAHILQEEKNQMSDYYYALAALKSKNYDLFHISRGIRIYRSDLYSKKLSNFLNDNMVISKNFYINNKDSKHVLITSSDPIYFKKYAQIFYHSAIKYGADNENITIHFHIINPDDECFILLNKMPFANYSIERITLSHFVKKAYYTIPRYSIILDLLSQYKSLDSFTVFDIDVAFDKNINYFLSSFDKYDIGLVLNGMRENYMLPEWSTICAGLAFFKNNKKSLDFIRFYNCYVSNVFDFDDCAQNANWLIDQMALYKAYKLYLEEKDVKYISRTSLVIPAQLYPGGKNNFIIDYKKIFNL
ncbi:TPA: hypothetical protein SG801_001663 [Campylobacter coli]|uniref:Uncharacterized protein n=1 Tax=Campylobacter jejuni TaxID=197 RepID=A0A698FMT4_CAMJU|nr:hypothetical protein [Campylobacter coli]HEH5157346.1 hypothetical protein [Campylobacter coli]